MMHTTPDLAARIVSGYVIVVDALGATHRPIHATGSRGSAIGIVADVLNEPFILQATLWHVTPNHAERLAVFAGAEFGPEAAI